MDLRPLILTLLVPVLACAQSQGPPIGSIEFYGLRKVPADKVRKALIVKEGDPLPSSKAEAEERIETVPGIVQAHLEAACCDSGKAILYVGVEEKGAPHFELREDPLLHLDLPEEVSSAYMRFLGSLQEAARKGEIAEDLRQGHSLLQNETARAAQLEFVDLAEKHAAMLRQVLRESDDDSQRAMAAYVLGYSKDKKKVVEDLQYAMRDPDPTVRSNAMRALGAIAVWTGLHPESEVRVSYTWFVEMLNSVFWTDRNNAAVALAGFTEKRDPAVLDQVRDRALTSIIEMARWKHLPHALPAFILAGRVAGLPEKEIQDAWSKGDRERVIQAALPKKK